MIRMRDSAGRTVLGLTRQEIAGLTAGNVCCYAADKPEAGMGHICIYFGETNADVLARIHAAYAANTTDAAAIAAPVDLRTRLERGDN